MHGRSTRDVDRWHMRKAGSDSAVKAMGAMIEREAILTVYRRSEKLDRRHWCVITKALEDPHDTVPRRPFRTVVVEDAMTQRSV